MAALRDCVRKMQENCGLTDDNNDLDQLKQTTNQLGRSLAELKDTTKVQAKLMFLFFTLDLHYCCCSFSTFFGCLFVFSCLHF